MLAQIGGSLAKLVYFSREQGDDSLGGRLNFLKFETDRIDTCIDFMRKLVSDHRDNGTSPSDLCVMATGGGAYKYYDKITEALGVEVIREDEMESLITGTAATHVFKLGYVTDCDRSGLLHQRDSQRSIHLQRRPAYGIRRTSPRPTEHLPIPARQHWLRCLYGQGLRTSPIRAHRRHIVRRRNALGSPIDADRSAELRRHAAAGREG